MKYTHDAIVIGAGAAGLTASGGCAMLGLRTALIERGEMGGDCLNTGCVPSKALIAAAHRAHDMRHAAQFGIADVVPAVDFAAVHAHVHDRIATIAPVDSQERFEGLGVEVLRGEGRFVDDRTVRVNGRNLTAPRIVIATGSSPAIPDIEGLDDVRYFTSENLWELAELPYRLVILGGGAIGMEMAQAFRRLGSHVVLATNGRPMGRDDADAAALVIASLEADGVEIRQNVRAEAISSAVDGFTLRLSDGNSVDGTHLLIAAGRTVHLDSLNLATAGVDFGPDGITTDARRRTSNKRIYAIGDCRVGPRFTHVSGYEGSNVILEIAFGLPTKVNFAALPWVTYTDPELAQVGLTEASARAKFGNKITVWRQDFEHNDRAIAERDTAGFVKVIKHKGKVVGATIVGRHAGDMLLPWSMAIAGKATTFGMASQIVPYPNRIEHSKAAAFASHEGMIFNKWTRRWAKFVCGLRGGRREKCDSQPA